MRAAAGLHMHRAASSGSSRPHGAHGICHPGPSRWQVLARAGAVYSGRFLIRLCDLVRASSGAGVLGKTAPPQWI
jgi:hypothetical protein